MKHLTVTYDPGTGPLQLFDGAIEELAFADTATGIKIEGRLTKLKTGGGQGAGLIDLLAKASKASTQKMIDEKRESSD